MGCAELGGGGEVKRKDSGLLKHHSRQVVEKLRKKREYKPVHRAVRAREVSGRGWT